MAKVGVVGPRVCLRLCCALALSGAALSLGQQSESRSLPEGASAKRVEPQSDRKPTFNRAEDPQLRMSLFQAWKEARNRERKNPIGAEGAPALLQVGAVGRASMVINNSNQVLFTRQFPGSSCDPDLGLATFWSPSTAYSVSDVVRRRTGVTVFFFRATTAGTTGATEPVWPTTFGGTVTDGTVVWQAVDRVWTASRAYPVGTTVQPIAGGAQFGFNFQVITAGTTGSTAPLWPTTIGATVNDGSVVWRAIGFFPGSFRGCNAMQLVIRASSGAETVIAAEGDPVGAAGSQLSGWAELYAMNNSGQAAFRSAIAGLITETDESGSAIFVAGPGPGTLTKISQSNDIVSGRGICGHSAIVGMNDAGQVLYDGYASRIPAWQLDTTYASGTTVVPTVLNGLVFVSQNTGLSGLTEPVWPTNIGATVIDGMVTWRAQRPGFGYCDENRHGIIRYAPGTGQELLFAVGTNVGGATVVGFGNDVVPATGVCPCAYNDIDGFLNPSGHASVAVRLSTGQTAAYLLTGVGAFTQIARTGGAGPGGAFGRIYPRTELNASDQVLFKAQVGGVDKLIRWTPPSTYAVVATVGDDIGTRSGGSPSGVTITALGFYGDLNGPGNAVFQATLSVAGNPKAYYFWDATTGLLTEIAREGTSFPPSFASEMVTLNDSNVVAFTSGARPQESAEEASEMGERGLHTWTRAGGVQNVIRIGDVVLGATVSSVYAQHPSFRRRQLNQSGCVATDYYVSGQLDDFDTEEGSPPPFFRGTPPSGQLLVSCGLICSAPPAPTLSLSPTTASVGQSVTLSWNGTLATGQGSYDVLRSAGGPFTVIASIPASSAGPFNFNYTVAPPTGFQDFQVRAVPSCNPALATTSNTVRLTVRTVVCPKPPAPLNLAIDRTTAAPGDRFTLTWTRLTSFLGQYVVLLSTDGGTNFGVIGYANDPPFTGTVAGPGGTVLTFGVRAQSSCGMSDTSNLVTLTVPAPCAAPGAVTNVRIQAAGVDPARPPSPSEFVLVSWTPAGDRADIRYSVRINGDPEVFTAGTSLILPPRGNRDPITAFVKPLACGRLFSAELYDPGTAAWSISGNLSTARQAHTATLLGNGKVLVAGGTPTAFGAALSSAELYDPAAGTWSATGSLNTARGLATATPLANGKVLVVGGFGSGPLARAELYDPAAGTWSATGSLNTARGLATATLLANGKVLIAGGVGDSPLASAELYDPATGTWSPTGNLNTRRYSHTATLLPNGRVLVAGGSGQSDVINGAELYDPATGTWASTGNLNGARQAHTATLLASGKVLVAGGDAGSSGPSLTGGRVLSSAELYEPASGTWSPTTNLGSPRTLHTATLLASGKVLVAGGSATLSGVSLKTVELYDPVSAAWSATGNLNGAHGAHGATLLPSGKVLLHGTPDNVTPETPGSVAQSETVALFLTLPVADFTISPPSPRVGSPVIFTFTGSGATAFLYIFDDGTTDTRQSSTHTFTTAGTHTVALVASSGAGSATKVQSFFVAPASAVTRAAQVTVRGFEPSDAERRRVRVEISGEGASWLRITTDETEEVTIFLRFVNEQGELVDERRLLVQPGSEALYDLAAYGHTGEYSLELVSGQKFDASLVETGRGSPKEIPR